MNSFGQAACKQACSEDGADSMLTPAANTRFISASVAKRRRLTGKRADSYRQSSVTIIGQ